MGQFGIICKLDPSTGQALDLQLTKRWHRPDHARPDRAGGENHKDTGFRVESLNKK
jgi:hypothetical protein